MNYHECPKCHRSDALGSVWYNSLGRPCRTCHGLGREHPGYKVHFDYETGEVIQPREGTHARLLNLLAAGTPMPFRGFPAAFLQAEFGVTGIYAAELEANCHSTLPALGSWARDLERQHLPICMVPITSGPRLVGVQLRPLPVGEFRRVEAVKDFRTVGETEGLLIPRYTGLNPSAVVVHEGPWGAISCHADAQSYRNTDIFSVAVLNASVKATTIKTTLDLVFPGVPRLSLFDQDPAGVAARMATAGVAKPILVTGAGPGKDYRDLVPELRFERLIDVVVRELKQMGAW